MLLPEHFKAYVKIRIDNQNFNKYVWGGLIDFSMGLSLQRSDAKSFQSERILSIGISSFSRVLEGA